MPKTSNTSADALTTHLKHKHRATHKTKELLPYPLADDLATIKSCGIQSNIFEESARVYNLIAV